MAKLIKNTNPDPYTEAMSGEMAYARAGEDPVDERGAYGTYIDGTHGEVAALGINGGTTAWPSAVSGNPTPGKPGA